MSHDWIIASKITVASYAMLFAYIIVRNLYREHVAIKKKNEWLELERNRPAWSSYGSEQAWSDAINEQNRLVNLGHSVDGYFIELQIDALQLATEILRFVHDLGIPPAPKYTFEEIQAMSSDKSGKLLRANDGDFIESCAIMEVELGQLTTEQAAASMSARSTRLYHWFQKVEGKYNTTLRGRVEVMRDRFAAEGLAEAPIVFALTFCFNPEERIRGMAIKFWEMAYKIVEKSVFP